MNVFLTSTLVRVNFEMNIAVTIAKISIVNKILQLMHQISKIWLC